LDKIHYQEGAEVQQGDLLFEIDPRPYEYALQQSQAQVSQQQANVKYQDALYARNLRLFNAGQTVSQEELQLSLSQRDTARANLRAAEAAVKQAQLNLGFTKVTSPITGRASRTLITRGNLIVADQTVLTTVVSMDPVYAYFDVDEPTVLRIQQLIREGRFKSAREKGVRVPVLLGLATEEGYPHEGHVDFINNQITSSTGTLQVRAVFENPKPKIGDRILSPGLFIRVRVMIGSPYEALLINQRAIGIDQNLRYVYAVDKQKQVSRRNVQLGTQHGALQVVVKGLTKVDRVVVSGLQKIHPGMAVESKLVPMPEEGEPVAEASSTGSTVQRPSGSQPSLTQQVSPPSGQRGK
jgi:multidrug efflux system membrane fusion protein